MQRESYIWKFNIDLLWWQWEFRTKGSKLFLLVKQFFLGVLSLCHNVAVLLMIRGVLILKFWYLLIPKSNYILSKSTNDQLPIWYWFYAGMSCNATILAALHMCTHWCIAGIHSFPVDKRSIMWNLS